MYKTFALILSLNVCSLVWAQPRWTPEQAEVVRAIEGYRAAWNSFDAARLAAFCDVDCDRIDARGNIYRGREAILRYYTRVFATPPLPVLATPDGCRVYHGAADGVAHG